MEDLLESFTFGTDVFAILAVLDAGDSDARFVVVADVKVVTKRVLLGWMMHSLQSGLLTQAGYTHEFKEDVDLMLTREFDVGESVEAV
jgi:hypothetical protein